jgi:hypothetical protein
MAYVPTVPHVDSNVSVRAVASASTTSAPVGYNAAPVYSMLPRYSNSSNVVKSEAALSQVSSVAAVTSKASSSKLTIETRTEPSSIDVRRLVIMLIA